MARACLSARLPDEGELGARRSPAHGARPGRRRRPPNARAAGQTLSRQPQGGGLARRGSALGCPPTRAAVGLRGERVDSAPQILLVHLGESRTRLRDVVAWPRACYGAARLTLAVVTERRSPGARDPSANGWVPLSVAAAASGIPRGALRKAVRTGHLVSQRRAGPGPGGIQVVELRAVQAWATARPAAGTRAPAMRISTGWAHSPWGSDPATPSPPPARASCRRCSAPCWGRSRWRSAPGRWGLSRRASAGAGCGCTGARS
jgi:hypothetical protein